jgi:hypothetical protein
MRTMLFPLFAARHHKSHARAAAFNLFRGKRDE